LNTVGPRQVGQYGMVVPRLVEQALLGQPLTVYGTGEQTRCFCHVSDVVRGLVGLMDSPAAEGTVVNLGSREEISVSGLAERVLAVTGSASPITYQPYDEAYEPGFEDMLRRRPDTTRAHSLIGWQPEHGLERIIADVAQDLGRRVRR